MITDLNKNKKKSYEVLNEFLNELHKLKYKDFFLSGGSLLGLIRNSNILISDDIDFCTKEEVLLKKIDVIANKLKKKNLK